MINVQGQGYHQDSQLQCNFRGDALSEFVQGNFFLGSTGFVLCLEGHVFANLLYKDGTVRCDQRGCNSPHGSRTPDRSLIEHVLASASLKVPADGDDISLEAQGRASGN